MHDAFKRGRTRKPADHPAQVVGNQPNVEPLGRLASVFLIVLVFIPLFFQLDGNIYTDLATVTAPRGAVTNLPIPVSVVVCALAMGLTLGRWTRDRHTLFLLATVPLMFVTSLVSGEGAMTWTKTKLLLFQFGVPLAGFALGRQVGRDAGGERTVGRCLLAVTVPLAVAQLLTTWLHHHVLLLSDDVFGIGIYGHLQYVPTIVLSAFVVGLFSIWGEAQENRNSRLTAAFFVPVLAAYVAASMSMTSILGLWVALAALVAWSIGRPAQWLAMKLLIVGVLLSMGYVAVATSTTAAFQSKFLGIRKALPDEAVYENLNGEMTAKGFEDLESMSDADRALREQRRRGTLGNLRERLTYWDYFLTASLSDWRAFLFGHPSQPPRQVYPSAHNYYFDLLYNFGGLAMLPLLIVGAVTVRGVWRVRRELRRSATLTGLVIAAFLLLVVDNGLKVGMRQPYPGLATFFLWGILASRIERESEDTRVAG